MRKRCEYIEGEGCEENLENRKHCKRANLNQIERIDP